MPEGATPESVAAVLLRGLPGRRTAEWDIDGPDGSAFLTLEGHEGNARIWMQATRIRLNSVQFCEDGLVIDHKRRGVGLAQRPAGNVVDLADAMGARSVELDTQDIGGYVWAKAGFVPRDWMSLRIQVEGRLDTLKRRRANLGDEEAIVRRMLGWHH